MVNTPIPHSLKSEAKKAAKILREFSVPTAKVGPDKLIPAGILLKAKGLAILTVVRAGFLVTARGGSGIVIAKINDDYSSTGVWSAPSAIGIAGLGGGFEIGAEVTDFVIILNSRAAVDAFSKGGNLTLGGNFSIAAGPLGRNVEADVSVRSVATMYTYSKTKGLFAGISIEGSGLIERKDANKKFYGRDIRTYEILSGEVEPPEECAALYEVLDMHQRRAEKQLLNMAKKQAEKQARQKLDDWGIISDHGKSYRSESHTRTTVREVSTKTKSERGTKSILQRTVTSQTKQKKTADSRQQKSIRSYDKPIKAIAKFTFKAELDCDISFRKGDEITVLTRTESNNDWWEGSCHGRTGIFPSNYIILK